MKVFSFGGGVQSMAVLVLSAQGKLDYTDFLFSNVGDDSENPKTLEYVAKYAVPYAEQHGLRLIEMKRERRLPSQPQTLYQELYAEANYVPIPLYLNGGGPQRRSCTGKWKIQVVDKYVRRHYGATKTNRIEIGVGISTDESHRMRTDDPERDPYTYKTYPLIDLMMNRNACLQTIANAGIPIPPKSSCYFCPYKKTSEWIEMSRTEPDLFQKAVELEDMINVKLSRRTTIHSDRPTAYGYLNKTKRPLSELRDRASMQPKMEGLDEDPLACESGYCMT